MVCFLLKYCVGQISSTTRVVIRCEKKLYKKKIIIKSSNEKNLKKFNTSNIINLFHQQVPLPVPCVNFTQIIFFNLFFLKKLKNYFN